MAYCVAGAYTIQNCLAVGTENLYGDIVLCGTNRSYGEGIVANPSPSGYMALFFRLEACQGSNYGCTWAIGKNAASAAGGELLQIVKEGLTGGTAYRVDASQQWKTNGDSIFGFNVGIGTTTPGDKLTIGGGGIISVFRSTNDRKGCLFTDSEGTKLSSDSAGNDPLYLLSPGASGQIRMCVGGNATMTIGASNVGIGTTSPTISGGGLEVARAGQAGIRVSSTGTNCGRVEIGSDDGLCRSYIQTMVPGGRLDFYTGCASVLTMTLLCNGNVGIGTTSPQNKLSVSGNVDLGSTNYAYVGQSQYGGITFPRGQILFSNTNSQNQLYLASNSYSSASGVFAYRSGSLPAAAVGLDNGNISFLTAPGGTQDTTINYTTVMTVTGSLLGVGTTTPSYKLHVNGTFYAAGSSIKYKEDICNYDTDSCLFMCLKPVTYQYKDEWQHLGRELKSQSQIGLIAEDVAEVMPELAVLVNEEDEKVVRNVDYEKLSVVLLKEVQKLRLEVDQLKNNK